LIVTIGVFLIELLGCLLRKRRLWLASFGLPLLVSAQPTPQRFEFHRGLMGTQFTLILYASDSLMANRVNAAVSARMDSLNQVMSDYLDGSEINRLSESSGSGRWVPVSADLFNVLQQAQYVAQQSGGRFDPTIGPLSLLWRRAVRRSEFPSRQERRLARRAVGYRLMKLDGQRRSVLLKKPGMRLDVGGIGQGFAIDEGLKILEQLNVKSALLDIGGDILVSDAPPGTTGWRVGVPDRTGADTTLLLTNAAITTSGDTHRFLLHKSRKYSHIMNPFSGLGIRRFVRVIVLAPDGYRADALTKVFSVARPGKRKPLLRRFPNVGVRIIENKKGQLRQWQSSLFNL
jgi:thiamine biosynthesis lipoprotein